jgi:hypothetical protein
VATAGADFASANTVTLATAGPFTVDGYCYENGTNTVAESYISTSQDNSAMNDYWQSSYVPFNTSDGFVVIGNSASGDTATNTMAWEGPYDGSTAAVSADGATAVNIFVGQGVWMQGATGPACSFSGFLVEDGS